MRNIKLVCGRKVLACIKVATREMWNLKAERKKPIGTWTVCDFSIARDFKLNWSQ